MQLATICKLEILHQFVFRNLNPAIFGVRVLTGKLRTGLPLIAENGEEIARVKSIQKDNASVQEAKEGDELALALPGVNFERRLKDKKYLYANINEKQFKDIIDYFGGIDIEVKNSFTDKKFPLEGKESDECNGDAEYRCRYETVHFTQGKQHMDGNTALKFVRSRNAIGKEGSDFARSLRQQAVTEEMKGKIVKTAFTFNLGKIKEMYSILDKSVQRDISNQQAAALGKKLIFDGKFYEKNFGLPRELFTIPDGSDYEGKYVLIPAVSFQNVYDYTHCLLSKEDEVKCSSLVKN